MGVGPKTLFHSIQFSNNQGGAGPVIPILQRREQAVVPLFWGFLQHHINGAETPPRAASRAVRQHPSPDVL